MSSVTFNKAVITNSKGVTLIESGRFEEAKETFEISLALMREAILDAGKDRILPTKRAASKRRSDCFRWSEIPKRSSSATSRRRRGDHISCSTSFFFQRAVIVEQPKVRRSANEYGEGTTAVVYNLALACHCMAIEQNSDAMLKRAVQFYKIAHSIFMHKTKTSPRSKDTCGMIMVIMNNLGQIHYDRMLEFNIAERCFQRLLTGLRGEESVDDEQTRNGFSADDFRGFMLNVMLGRPLLSAAA
mmetsp:Transcript_4734/g.7866  ORF Transcript_4734/g.7866 Transcript_4734/m.7866 type:complete len:244 (-) Transcript_4734:36-767(-)|eukprot:CAMPEP_0119012960 /NCGR_PEP_ID=MMETSP1176-20130426/7719_1 /TAXON_ID=265551 /ORGANISM="Synedropsis recta cf, Strain CCMP1620" /LENGTH=243 /DNA_ID=CAMNT_0006966001 /DNA_START=109 /DNA_END=840 /DNA_ORIENTATION=+